MREKGFYAILSQGLSFLRINVSLHSSRPASVQTSPFVPGSLSMATFGRTTSSGDYQRIVLAYSELKVYLIRGNSRDRKCVREILKFKFQSFFFFTKNLAQKCLPIFLGRTLCGEIAKLLALEVMIISGKFQVDLPRRLH